MQGVRSVMRMSGCTKRKWVALNILSITLYSNMPDQTFLLCLMREFHSLIKTLTVLALPLDCACAESRKCLCPVTILLKPRTTSLANDLCRCVITKDYGAPILSIIVTQLAEVWT